MNEAYDMTRVKRSILTIDRNTNFLTITKMILQDAGYQVYLAGTQSQGLQLSRTCLPSLILLDWQLAKANDFELINSLQDAVATESVPVIVTLGDMTPITDLQSIKKLGVADYIRKPLDTIELLTRIDMTLSRVKSLRVVEERDQMKNRLLAIVSHDLRSPLSSFQGLLAYIKSIGPDQLQVSTAYRLITGVEDEFDRVVHMANGLLYWALDQEDAICCKRQVCNLSELLWQTIKVYCLQAGQKNIKIDLDIVENAEVFADPNLLCFIIRNLLSNAIKFSPSHGDIRITVTQDDHDVRLAVSDSGPGIKQEAIHQLFQQMGTSKSTPGSCGERGTGLGLTVADDFARKLGGRLTVKSVMGEGSTFQLYLPGLAECREANHPVAGDSALEKAVR